MTIEMMMMVIALIAIFITILGGFGSIVAFLWQQFSKINATLLSIKHGYVTDEECEKRRSECRCKLDHEFDQHRQKPKSSKKLLNDSEE